MQEPRPEHGTLSMSNSAKCHSAMFCEVVTDDTVQAGSRRNIAAVICGAGRVTEKKGDETPPREFESSVGCPEQRSEGTQQLSRFGGMRGRPRWEPRR